MSAWGLNSPQGKWAQAQARAHAGIFSRETSMPSQQYEAALEASKKHHAENKTFSGKLFRPHAPYVKGIIDRLGVGSILDYGCGKGLQYQWRCDKPTSQIPLGMTIEEYWGVPVTKYDPAYPPYAEEPTGKKFDLVICTHTLSTIPISDLGWVVDRLHLLADKAIYIAEQLGPIKKKLADRSLDPVGWTKDQWLKALRRDSPIEVTLSLRSRTSEGTIVDRSIVT